MTITLKKCLSDNHKIGKEFKSGEDDTLTIATAVLKDECSVSDPVIRLTQSENTADITLFNYMEIPAFSRKYFIKNIRHIANGLWEIEAHVDVLDTYQAGLLTAPCFVKEREAFPDYYINDEHTSMESRTIEQVLLFDGDETDKTIDDVVIPGDWHVDSEGKCCFDANAWVYIIIMNGPTTTTPNT